MPPSAWYPSFWREGTFTCGSGVAGTVPCLPSESSWVEPEAEVTMSLGCAEQPGLSSHQCPENQMPAPRKGPWGLLTPPPTRRQAHAGCQPEETSDALVGQWLTSLFQAPTQQGLARALPSLATVTQRETLLGPWAWCPPSSRPQVSFWGTRHTHLKRDFHREDGSSAKNQELIFLMPVFSLCCLKKRKNYKGNSIKKHS